MGGDLKEVGEAGIWGRAFLAKGTASAKSEHQSQHRRNRKGAAGAGGHEGWIMAGASGG